MAFRDILLALTTHPEPTPVPAVIEAIDFAAAVGGRISAIACAIEFPVPGSFLADLVLDLPAMAAAEARRSSTNAEHLLREFHAAAESRSIFQERILEHGLTLETGRSIRIEYRGCSLGLQSGCRKGPRRCASHSRTS